MSEERREHPRVPVTLLVEYPGAAELTQDYTANLSVGGTFVYTDREFEVGTPVELVLSFPGLLQPIEFTGQVRWCGTDPSGENRGIGIEFTNFDNAARAQINSVLNAIQSGDSRFIEKSSFNLLIIEDNVHLAQLIANGIRQFGRGSEISIDVDVTVNGEEGLHFLDENTYDALIVDLYTPVMSGTDFIAAVRKRSGFEAACPIIAISGGRGDEPQVAKAAGSDAFLFKPFRLRDLLETLAGLVHGVPSP